MPIFAYPPFDLERFLNTNHSIEGDFSTAAYACMLGIAEAVDGNQKVDCLLLAGSRHVAMQTLSNAQCGPQRTNELGNMVDELQNYPVLYNLAVVRKRVSKMTRC